MRQLLIIISIILTTQHSFAQNTFDGSSSSNWNTAANWSLNRVPLSTDDVIIPDGLDVIINTNAVCNSLTMAAGNTNTEISFSSSTNSLTVTGAITFTALTNRNGQTRNHTLNIGSASLSCASISMVENGGNEESIILISTGSLTVTGNISMTATTASENKITFSSNGSLTVGGTWSNNGTFTQSTSKVHYNGTSAQTIRNATYYDIELSGSGEKTLASNITIAPSGSFVLNENCTLNGAGNRIVSNGANVSISIFGILKTSNSNGFANNANATISNSNSPTLTIGTNSVIDYTLSGNQTITGGIQYGILRVSATGTKTLNTNAEVHNNVEVNAGTFAVGNNTIDIDGNLSGAGAITLGSGIINLKGNFSNTGTLTAGTSTINFNGSTNQNIKSATYYKLKITGAGTKTLLGNTTVSNQLDLDSAELDINTRTLTIQGTTLANQGRIKAGTCSAASGVINITGTGAMGDLKFSDTHNYLSSFTLNRTSSGTANVKSSLHISGTLTLTAGALVIDSALNFYGSNTPISRTSGTLTMNPNSSLIFGSCNANGNAFTLPASLFTTAPVFKKLGINRTNAITLNAQVMTITNEVEVLAGTLNTSNNLVLESDANTTARISKLTGTANVNGNVTVKRFVPGGNNKRRWRFMGSPVNVGGTGIALTQIIDDIHVTGVGGTTNGFDDCSTCSPSLRFYDETITGASGNGWVNPANINTEIPTGKGFELFVRGDRTLANPFDGATVPNNATIDFIGAVNKGNYTFNLSFTNTGAAAADGFNLVANPYPSQIDWMSGTGWTKTNIANYFWTYNPNSGNYGVFDQSSGVGINGITRNIAIGQAYFVKALSSGASISMTEDVKTNGTPFNFFRSSNAKSYIRLKLISTDNEDETIVLFGDNSTKNAGDVSDAGKFFNDRLNLYSKSQDNINLAINDYPYLSDDIDTINLSVFSYNTNTVEPGRYKIELSEKINIPSGYTFALHDYYTNQTINLNTNPIYAFEISDNAKTYGNDRFDLLISKNFTGILNEKQEDVIVYPNPSEDFVYISLLNNTYKDSEFRIFDLQGKIVLQGLLLDSEIKLNLESLENGIYILEINNNQEKIIKKILKSGRN